MKVLVFTTLYPNAASPNHGVFVENRVRNLVADTGVSVRVIAPVPWFPFSHPRFGVYAAHARAPRRETRHGIAVIHPRYPVIPKIGMSLQPLLLYLGTRRAIRQMRAAFDFDVIDAHYFYPDGVAAVLHGRSVARPVVMTARGNDLTLLPRYAGPRAWLRWAVRRAAGLAAVCDALRGDYVERLGGRRADLRVLRNGVDLVHFTPDGPAALSDLRSAGKRIVLSVGQLIERKGHHLTIEALTHLPDDVVLVIAGEGPERRRLQALAERLGVGERTVLLGSVGHDDLPAYYRAATLSVLASSREGWANVLLESLACGTPVVATAVSGTPEVIRSSVAGELVYDRSAACIAAAVNAVLARPPSAARVREYAEAFSWRETTEGQMQLFQEARRCTGSASTAAPKGHDQAE